MPVEYTERGMIKYTQKLIERLKNPKNIGEMENPTVVATEGDPQCGDMFRMFLKIENDRIEDMKFLSFGCAANIATGDMTADLVKGKTVQEVGKLQIKEIVDGLGGLPVIKMHCATLAYRTLKKALTEYRQKHAGDAQAQPRG